MNIPISLPHRRSRPRAVVFVALAWLAGLACAGGDRASQPAAGSEPPIRGGGEEGAGAVSTENEERGGKQAHSELYDLVRDHGEARLIVTLAASESGLSSGEIAALVDAWLAEMPSEHVAPGRRFQSMPSLVVTVDATGLEAVIASERVEMIEVDGLSSPPEPSGV